MTEEPWAAASEPRDSEVTGGDEIGIRTRMCTTMLDRIIDSLKTRSFQNIRWGTEHDVDTVSMDRVNWRHVMEDISGTIAIDGIVEFRIRTRVADGIVHCEAWRTMASPPPADLGRQP